MMRLDGIKLSDTIDRNFGPVGQCVPPHNRWNKQVQQQLRQLIQMGASAELIEVVHNGFVVSTSGRQLSPSQVALMWETYQAASPGKEGRAYVNPDPWYVASSAAVSHIKVFIVPVQQDWENLIIEALGEWNKPALESCINIEIVHSAEAANCIAEVYYKDDQLLGKAEWPKNRQVGEKIEINSYYSSAQYTRDYYYNTIVHEMGHAMGISHSGGEDGIFGIPDTLVPGTNPDENPDDVMFTSAHPWPSEGFSADERLAIKTLFARL